MNTFIPLEKRSKKEQRAHHAKQRGSWGSLNPVTRKPPAPKAYRRHKNQYRQEDSYGADFLCAKEGGMARGRV